MGWNDHVEFVEMECLFSLSFPSYNDSRIDSDVLPAPAGIETSRS
jgi:hypothetical protein